MKWWTKLVVMAAAGTLMTCGWVQACEENESAKEKTPVLEKVKEAAESAADQSVSAAKAVAADVKEISGKAVEQAGQAAKKIGDSLPKIGEKAGEAAAP